MLVSCTSIPIRLLLPVVLPVLEDYKGRNLLVFTSYWAIDFTCRRNPGLQVSEIVVSEG